MRALFVTVRMKPEYRDQILKGALEDGRGSREDEPGCLRFDVFQDEIAHCPVVRRRGRHRPPGAVGQVGARCRRSTLDKHFRPRARALSRKRRTLDPGFQSSAILPDANSLYGLLDLRKAQQCGPFGHGY